MLRPDGGIAATPATAASRPTPSLAAAGGLRSGSGFPALFGEVQNDVADFIENGSGASVSTAMPQSMATLSPEAQVYRDGLQSNVAPSGAAGPVQQDFLAAIAPFAQETGQRLGVSPEIVAAHAALESGWGQKPLRAADGAATNNLFGLKAGGAWQGDTADALTTEYLGGAATKKVERFRSYPDQASAFRDYAQMLIDNPRYHGALNVGSDAHAFAQGLARGGYATDPAYVSKLARLATRIQSGE